MARTSLGSTGTGACSATRNLQYDPDGYTAERRDLGGQGLAPACVGLRRGLKCGGRSGPKKRLFHDGRKTTTLQRLDRTHGSVIMGHFEDAFFAHGLLWTLATLLHSGARQDQRSALHRVDGDLLQSQGASSVPKR